MARLETWYKQDLKRPLFVHKHTDVFNQDSKGNLIGVEVYSDGEPVVLSGSISGYCLLANGTTVPAVGASRSGNKASVLIPQTAYSVPGPITITIKNVEGDNITTLCATVGIVRQSVSGNLVNPGSVVTDWSNNINAQLQAVQTAADNVGAIVADPFDENTVYAVGNYVTNNGNLYRITADHAAGVAWADTTKVQCTVGNELSELKSALNMIYNATWLYKANQAAQVYSYTFTAGTTYIAKNFTTGINVNLRTCTSDGTEIEVIKNGITPGEYVFFTPTQNASYVRLYATGQNTNVIIGTYGELFNRYGEIDLLEKGIGLEWDIGHFVSSTGGVGNATDRACTGFIPCAEGVSVSYVGENNNESVYGVSFFDKYFKVVGGDSNSGNIGAETTVTSPSGTAYIRLSTKINILKDSYFTINDNKKTTLVNIANLVNDVPIYVDGINGNDSTGNGSLTARYKTIGKAISVGATKIGIFPNSTYNETISLNGKDIHLFSYIDSADEYSESNQTRPKATISGNDTVQTALTIQNANNVILEDIIVTNCTFDGCVINKCQNVVITACEFNSNDNNGIVFNNSNGVFHDCIAHDNGHDGFNLNYFGNSQFYNCSGYNNGDDGISHHQGTTGLIDGGEWYGNAKGGVSSPCYGAKVDIRNVYTHDNKFGIYAFSTGATDARAFRIWNCVVTNNTEYGVAVKYNIPYLYGNKISGNTVGQTTGYGTTTFHTLD